MLKFGNIELKHGLMLAPMAGFSDRAMRVICREHGAEYSVTEMVSARAVTFKDKKTASIARIGADEGKVALQIFGSEPSIMAQAAAMLECGVDGYAPPVAIDINMGCPVHKIFSNAEGSALMRSPELICQITSAVCRATHVPVTVKMRLGIDRTSVNAVECALAAQEGGASLITVHGRTRSEMYSGEVDRESIKKVKDSLQIPLIANGDVCDAESALRLLRDTGADGIMIGRGAVGNPFIFEEIVAALEGRDYSAPQLEQRVAAAIRQLELAVEDKGERIAIPEARKQIALYLKGFRGASTLRARINASGTLAEVKEALKHAADDLCSSV